jgi:DNA-binding NtrC family response regulator
MTGRYDLVIADYRMPGMDGDEMLGIIRRELPELPGIIVTEHGSVEHAVQALKHGVDYYLLKPVSREELLVVVERCLRQADLRRSWSRQRELEKEGYSFQAMKSRSTKMGKVLELAEQVAAAPLTTIALCGESGTGKEVLAKAIHVACGLPLSKFIAINCAALPEALLESELFGHVKGAYTGAEQSRDGKCTLADGGTLFFDEIGDMPLSLQAKLLRLLEERVYEKVGSNTQLHARFRVVVATNRDLDEWCRRGLFREDLYHRVMVFPLELPPLRERKEDIPALVSFFLEKHRQDLGKPLPGISKAAMNTLLDHDWPGNVRELKNCLEYAVIVNHEDLIRPEHLRLDGAEGTSKPAMGQNELQAASENEIHLNLVFSKEDFSLDSVNQKVLQWALGRCRHNKTAAARLLKISRKVFYY